jgi:diguanylate cyclase (GGDEF)-like protein
MPGPAARKPVVLIADDEEDIRDLVRVNLVNEYEVIGASSGRECVQKAMEHRPDVILLDIMMPAMDGREVLIELSDHAATRHIPVIFLSALTQPDDRVSGLESGAVDYITKPADPREIAARVAAAIRKTSHVAAEPDRIELPGRDAFEARIAEEVARAARHRAPLSILLVGIDPTQDDRSAPHGDDDQREQVASALRATLRLSDSLFSYGTGAFAVVLPDTNSATAFLAAERCRSAVSSSGRSTTVSVGIAEHTGSSSGEDLIAKAEIALYRAKDSGGDRCWRADDLRRHGLSPRSLAGELTQREWDVLAHLVKRRTEPEIARHLGISTGTVRSHKARIRRKLQVAPNVKLSDFARENLKDLVEHLNERTRGGPGSAG